MYERLNEVRTYHAGRKRPLEEESSGRFGNPVADGYDLAALIPQWTATLDTDFTSDEVMGKYLDLHSFYHELMQNLSNRCELPYPYIDFLEDLAKGMVWKEDEKLLRRKKYFKWLQSLESYLKQLNEPCLL